jgi:hypothetical protein
MECKNNPPPPPPAKLQFIYINLKYFVFLHNFCEFSKISCTLELSLSSMETATYYLSPFGIPEGTGQFFFWGGGGMCGSCLLFGSPVALLEIKCDIVYEKQCCGSGSVGSICFWAFRIRFIS